MDIIIPVKQVTVSALAPRYFEQCILFNPTPPLADNVDPIIDTGISTPVAPGITYESIPVITEIIDTSPSQLIGCVNDTTPEVQYRLNHEFPDAIEEDGVVDRSTNDIWVLRDGAWVNVGPTPGPTIVVQSTVAVWNEIVPVVSRTRTTISVQSLNYALASETTVDPIVTKTEISVTSAIATILNPPAINISIAGQTPIISTGYRVLAPVGDISVATAMPVVSTGVAIAAPVAGITVAGGEGPTVPREATVVAAPAGEVSIAGAIPAISTGVSVSVPAKDIAIAGQVPVAGPTDANFSSVSLLLHMDGTNGSTTFTDNSSNSLTVTANNGAAISTAESKFGGASGIFDGSDNYLSIATNTLLSLPGDFTIEFWFYPVASTSGGIFANGASSFGGTAANIVYDHSTATDRVCLFHYPTSATTRLCQTGVLSLSTWYHVAFVRSGTTVTAYLDGVAGTSGTSSQTFNFSATETRIGRSYSGYVNGYIDELRVTKGVARYTSGFTAPSSAFPNQ